MFNVETYIRNIPRDVSEAHRIILEQWDRRDESKAVWYAGAEILARNVGLDPSHGLLWRQTGPARALSNGGSWYWSLTTADGRWGGYFTTQDRVIALAQALYKVREQGC